MLMNMSTDQRISALTGVCIDVAPVSRCHAVRCCRSYGQLAN
uniref:Uncharacterized protein n=1 Tax=Anguilla anguilla TaxID=7936 RepID=A0A0E9VXX2_ANGAN